MLACRTCRNRIVPSRLAACPGSPTTFQNRSFSLSAHSSTFYVRVTLVPGSKSRRLVDRILRFYGSERIHIRRDHGQAAAGRGAPPGEPAQLLLPVLCTQVWMHAYPAKRVSGVRIPCVKWEANEIAIPEERTDPLMLRRGVPNYLDVQTTARHKGGRVWRRITDHAHAKFRQSCRISIVHPFWALSRAYFSVFGHRSLVRGNWGGTCWG